MLFPTIAYGNASWRMKHSRHPKVFLLVEDDEHDAFFVEREFKTAPQDICLKVVRDGQEAIDYISAEGRFADRNQYPIPNVILLDLKMPRLNGFEFLQWLRRSAANGLKTIPVIVMSSSNLNQDVSRAYELGANSYLVKPVQWKKFKELIAELGFYWTQHALTPQF